MVSYSHRLQSGHIVCYLDRTYHGLTTKLFAALAPRQNRAYASARTP
jgi:hypothetical protein